MNTVRLILLLAAGLTGFSAAAHQGSHDKSPKLPQQDFTAIERKSRDYFTDTSLVDQHNRPLRFYSDVLKGKTVLINVIYTDCKDACPLITKKLVEARQALPAAAQDSIRFVSISVDPERDTPAALRAYARAQDADHPSWFFLTGRKSLVDGVTRRLGQYASEPQMHTSLLIAGNVDKGHWIKVRPDTRPELIAERLQELSQP